MEPAKKSIRTDELMDTDGPIKSEQSTAFFLGDVVNEPETIPAAIAMNEVAGALKFLAEVRDLKSVSDSQEGRLPEKIGRYRILSSAGRGGFSEVFHAVDEDLQRHVALKIPLVSGREDYQVRFEREARLAAMLSHRQIVPVYEFGGIGELDFIAYSWVEGETLAQWLASNGGLVDGKLAAKIVAELARAMHFAHERGVVHRDLKPANVLIDQSETSSQQSIELRTRITDLGLSRNLSEEDQRLTQTGQALGTPAYMSPEQVGGDSDIGFGTDIYSLGIILFKMVTGELPFRKSNVIATYKAIQEQPAPSASRIRKGVSQELAAIVDKCLQKKAKQRYLSAFELAEDLDAFVEDRPVSARSLGLLARTSRWIGRNRVLTATTAMVLLSLSVGLGTALWQWNIATKESIRANREADRAVKEADRASSHLNSMFRAIDLMLADNKFRSPAEVPASQKKLLMEILSLQRSIVHDREADEFTLSQLDSLSRVAKIHRFLGQYEASYEMIRDSLALFEELDFAELKPDECEEAWRSTESIFLNYVFFSRRMDHPQEALAAIDEFERVFERAKPCLKTVRSTYVSVFLLSRRGMLKYRVNELDESLGYLEAAQDLVEDRRAMLEDPDGFKVLAGPFANVYATLARTQSRMDMRQEAWQTSLKSLEIMKPCLERFPESTELQKNMGLLQMNMAQWTPQPGADEKRQLDEGIEVYESILEKYPTDNYAREVLAYGYSSTITLMQRMKNSAPDQAISPDEGLANLDKLNQLVEQGLLETDYGRTRYLTSLGKKTELLLKLERNDLAFAAALEAVEVAAEFENAPGENHRDYILTAWDDLLKCQQAMSDREGLVHTVAEIKKFVASEKERTDSNSTFLDKQHTTLAKALWTGSETLAELGRFDEAVSHVHQHFDTNFVSGKHEGHRRYRSSARLMSIILASWRESQTDLPESYQRAKDDAIQWLELGIENEVYPSTSLLGKSSWEPLRDDARFKAIVEQAELRASESGRN